MHVIPAILNLPQGKKPDPMIKQRILVVDDDKDVVRLMQGYLDQSGYEVLLAYNGESALQIIRREHPDLVLIDLMLPKRDGLEITRLLRNDPNLKHIPIIMLTARVSDADQIVGLEIGADDYVNKPYNLPGAGLGLVITQAIVQAHGGRIEVERAGLNQGSTFTLWLPVEAGEVGAIGSVNQT
jgi:CheY-like chemotaxis protein